MNMVKWINHRQPPPASTTGDLTLPETAVAEKVRKTEPAGNHLRRRETRRKPPTPRDSSRSEEDSARSEEDSSRYEKPGGNHLPRRETRRKNA
ncbi:hypothetical protein LXL04_033711 [Taraxacum kok-saghyz]